eukprot:9264809-Alexandrium_andersonii.AAC.1
MVGFRSIRVFAQALASQNASQGLRTRMSRFQAPALPTHVRVEPNMYTAVLLHVARLLPWWRSAGGLRLAPSLALCLS